MDPHVLLLRDDVGYLFEPLDDRSIHLRTFMSILLFKLAQVCLEPSHILRHLTRTIGDVIVPSVWDPPTFASKIGLDGIVQCNTMGDIDLLIELAVNDHYGTVYLLNPVDIGEDIKTCQRTAWREDSHT